MDRSLAKLERQARTAPGDRGLQQALAEAYARAGRRVEAYRHYLEHGFLDEPADTTAAMLGAALRSEQRPALAEVLRAAPAFELATGLAGDGRFVAARDDRPVLGLSLHGTAPPPALAKLTTLRLLHLPGTGTRDQDLRPILSLVWLEVLDLGDCPITDGGVASLAVLPRLRHLLLESTQVTGVGFHAFRRGGLEQIVLDRSPVNDTGLLAISRLPGLDRLDLFGTQVTDRGVAALANARGLQRLTIMAPGLSLDGAAFLEDALPDCLVEYFPPE